jgi:ABC-2 type transport system permease protein
VPAPAVWVVVGATVALFGLVPRAVVAAWGVLGACVVVTILGPLLDLPDWVLDLSPFRHAPRFPVDDLRLAPLLALVAATAVLALGGVAGLRHRDVA